MQIKRFEAKDIQEALRQVKETLGSEAIILSTQTIKRPKRPYSSEMGSWIEVVAAIDPPSQSGESAGVPRGSSFGAPNLDPKPVLRMEENPSMQAILSSGLSPGFVRELVGTIKELHQEGHKGNKEEIFQKIFRWKLMESIDVLRPDTEGTKIWAFVGPTGVGKTTTLAKVAAHFRLRENKKISLVTLDTYRIGAIEQLNKYARILRLSLEVAEDAEALKQIIDQQQGQDLLLIDTPGRNPNRREQMEELKEVLTADPRVENHLVLSATTKDTDLGAIVQQFSILPIRSYIFTKIDETAEYTSLFNQLLRYKKPLSYLTNGQKVPEDIEPATKGRVANLVLNSMQWN